MEKVKSHKDLVVWQKAMDLVVLVYALTKYYPSNELFVLTSQTNRSAISIPSNIAEGKRRRSKKEFIQFLSVAFGSCAELETQIEIAKRVGYVRDAGKYQEISSLLTEIMKMLYVLIHKL